MGLDICLIPDWQTGLKSAAYVNVQAEMMHLHLPTDYGPSGGPRVTPEFQPSRWCCVGTPVLKRLQLLCVCDNCKSWWCLCLRGVRHRGLRQALLNQTTLVAKTSCPATLKTPRQKEKNKRL